jgi:hypothetical protein
MASKITPARALLFGTLTVAVLDITDAIVFWALRGAHPIRVFQGIAGGFFGRATFEGGIRTALIGAAVHVLVSFSVVSVYYLASGRLALLARRPWVFGPIYGLLVYLFMYRVVIPLSAASPPHYSFEMVANQLFAHLCLVGLPAALFVGAARSGGTAAPGATPARGQEASRA